MGIVILLYTIKFARVGYIIFLDLSNIVWVLSLGFLLLILVRVFSYYLTSIVYRTSLVQRVRKTLFYFIIIFHIL